MSNYNFSFFQLSSGIHDDSPLGNQQSRFSGSRLSNFGALGYGTPEGSDYTKFSNTKSSINNPIIPDNLPTGYGNLSNAINNPQVVGSTTNKTRKGEFDILSFGTREVPGADVMDSKAVAVPSSIVNLPTEGFKSFGTHFTTNARPLNIENYINTAFAYLFQDGTPYLFMDNTNFEYN